MREKRRVSLPPAALATVAMDVNEALRSTGTEYYGTLPEETGLTASSGYGTNSLHYPDAHCTHILKTYQASPIILFGQPFKLTLQRVNASIFSIM